MNGIHTLFSPSIGLCRLDISLELLNTRVRNHCPPPSLQTQIVSSRPSPCPVAVMISQSDALLHSQTSSSCLTIAFIEPLSTSKPSSFSPWYRAVLSNMLVTGHSPLAQIWTCWKCEMPLNFKDIVGKNNVKYFINDVLYWLFVESIFCLHTQKKEICN